MTKEENIVVLATKLVNILKVAWAGHYPGGMTELRALDKALEDYYKEQKKLNDYLTCVHDWKMFIADERLPYSFCSKCKSTAYNGDIYLLNKDDKRTI